MNQNKLIQELSDEIMKLIHERADEEMTNSDLQGVCEAIILKAIQGQRKGATNGG